MIGAHVQPWPGEGLVARFGGTVLVVPGPASQSTVELLLSRCAATSGSALVQELARLAMAAAPDDATGFGVVTPVTDGVAAFLTGSLRLRGTAGGEQHDLDASDVVTWIDQRLANPVEALAIGPADAEPPEPSPWLELREGVVAGAGALVLAEAPRRNVKALQARPGHADDAGLDEAAGESRRPSPGIPMTKEVEAWLAEHPRWQLVFASERQGFSSISLGPDADLLAGREPLPAIVPEPGTDDELQAEPGAVSVKGFRCPRDHHNRPGANYCCICGIRMGTNRTLVLVDGPRPPLGVLVFDDGGSVPVRRDLVIGREPANDPLVKGDEAWPVQIKDDTHSVSRAHLRVMLREWDVLVVDRGSSNGTLIRPGDGDAWERLSTEEPRLIATGAQISMGERELVFEQLHVR